MEQQKIAMYQTNNQQTQARKISSQYNVNGIKPLHCLYEFKDGAIMNRKF